MDLLRIQSDLVRSFFALMEKLLQLTREYEGNVKLGGLQIQSIIGLRKQQRACLEFAAETEIRMLTRPEYTDSNLLCNYSPEIEFIKPNDMELLGMGIWSFIPDLFADIEQKQNKSISEALKDLGDTCNQLTSIVESMKELQKSILGKAKNDKVGSPTDITIRIQYTWISEVLVGYKIDLNQKSRMYPKIFDSNLESLYQILSKWNNCDDIDFKLQMEIAERLALSRAFS